MSMCTVVGYFMGGHYDWRHVFMAVTFGSSAAVLNAETTPRQGR